MQRNNAVEEIKSRCNIVDVIGRVVPLKKAGSNYKGICPFHNEKTSSFIVSEQKQIFTCFGCGATGDVIAFVQKYYNLDFLDAIERLANEYGITIDKSSFRKNEKNDKLYEINRDAANFFYKALTTKANTGYAYMKNRGIEPATLKKFGIGYADEKWDSLYTYLKSKGHDDSMLLDLGLISNSKGKYYDKFRNRVMFPIINTRGKVIGFGGRIIGDAEPKYLNSQESPIFLKKNNLYGLNLTKHDISKENCAILVEGYMDVISLYQSGVQNVSASLGTALTDNQAALLKRYTDGVILSYDADDAGRKAALRGLDILYGAGMNVKVLHVTDGKDPDEFVKKKGKEAFIELTKKALPYADYKIEHIKREVDIATTEGRVEFIKRAITVLKALSPSEADIYIKKIAADMKISEGAIRMELYGNDGGAVMNAQALGSGRRNPGAGSDAANMSGQASVPKAIKNAKPISAIEKHLIKITLTDASYYHKVAAYSYIFRNEKASAIWKAIKSVYREGEEIDAEAVREALEIGEQDVFDDIMKNTLVAGYEEQIYLDSVRRIEISEMKKRESEIKVMLSLADEEENGENIKELTEELMEIQKWINEQGGSQ